MIWNILQLIFCITLFVLPLALYKSHRSFMVRFYDAMIHSVKARKLYVQVVLILLFMGHRTKRILRIERKEYQTY